MKISKSILFVGLRYGTLFINAARGFYLASSLGPKSYGIYALVMLAYQQLSVLGFGLREGITLKLSGVSKKDKIFTDTLSNILSFTFIISLFLIVSSFALYYFRVELGAIHEAMYYSSVVFQIASVTINCEILANTQRILGNVLRVGQTEFSYSILCLLSIFFVNQLGLGIEYLFYFILAINFCVMSFYFSLVSKFFKPSIKKNILKPLLQSSFPLLVLNTLLLLMQTLGQWFVGSYSNSIEIGIYSFGASLAIVAGNGISSIAWAYFSEVMGFIKNSTDLKKISSYLLKIRKYIEILFYITASISGISIHFFLEIFFPNYIGADQIFIPLMFSVLFQNVIFADTALLISREKIKSLIITSSVFILILISFCFFVFNTSFLANMGLSLTNSIARFIMLMNISVSLIILLLSSRYLNAKFYNNLIPFLRLTIFSISFLILDKLGVLEFFSFITIFLTLAFSYKEIVHLRNSSNKAS